MVALSDKLHGTVEYLYPVNSFFLSFFHARHTGVQGCMHLNLTFIVFIFDLLARLKSPNKYLD